MANPAGVTGFLNVAKPMGPTSRDVVNRLQRWVKPAKIGHTGTLDPLATGVLVICVGAATRLVPYVQDQRKRYRATFRFGWTSDTEDITGRMTSHEGTEPVTRAQLLEVLGQFRGTISQTPPKVSAVHVQGRRAYDLARQGVEFELTPRTVEIEACELLDYSERDWTIDLLCGGGTYVRSLGRDVGERLGWGVVMTALERTAVGPFTLADAVPLDDLTPQTWREHLCSPLVGLPEMPRVSLKDPEVQAIRCGRALPWPNTAVRDHDVALCDAAGTMLGVGRVEVAGQRLQPTIVFPML